LLVSEEEDRRSGVAVPGGGFALVLLRRVSIRARPPAALSGVGGAAMSDEGSSAREETMWSEAGAVLGGVGMEGRGLVFHFVGEDGVRVCWCFGSWARGLGLVVGDAVVVAVVVVVVVVLEISVLGVGEDVVPFVFTPLPLPADVSNRGSGTRPISSRLGFLLATTPVLLPGPVILSGGGRSPPAKDGVASSSTGNALIAFVLPGPGAVRGRTIPPSDGGDGRSGIGKTCGCQCGDGCSTTVSRHSGYRSIHCVTRASAARGGASGRGLVELDDDSGAGAGA